MTLGLLLGMQPGVVMAEEENPVEISVAGSGTINIYPDGYEINGGTRVPHTGAYVLTGSGNSSVNFIISAEEKPHTFDVTLRNMQLSAGQYRTALRVNDGITLNLTVDGDNMAAGSNHPGLQMDGQGSAAVNITLLENSRLTLSSYEGSVQSIAEAITATVTNQSGVSGLSNLNNRNSKLVLGTGTLHEHENVRYQIIDDEKHQITCSICGTNEETHAFNMYTSAGEEGHQASCICGAVSPDILPHNGDYDDYDEEGHIFYCNGCGYESELSEHQFEDWEKYNDRRHVRKCIVCGHYEYAQHNWDDGTPFEATPDSVGGTRFTCEVCGASRIEENPEGAMTIQMYDAAEDGWDSARLLVYRDGELRHKLTMEFNRRRQNIYLPYMEESGYVFVWQKGSWDEECGVTITLPGETSPVFSERDFDDILSGSVLFALNQADYTDVKATLAEVPSDLDRYSEDSVRALLEAISEVNLYLPVSQQEQVNAYASEIRSAINALVPQSESSGCLNLTGSDEDLIINSTGYRWGENGEEVPYTGKYILTGSTTTIGVRVESGSPEIELYNLSISAGSDKPAFDIAPNAEVSLLLTGRNNMQGDYSDQPAVLHVPEDASLHVLESSAGSLDIRSSYCGIGGEYGTGTIIIDGGDISVMSDIAIGSEFRDGVIEINGGNITAYGDSLGIGYLYNGAGTITVNGGTITAGAAWGAAIGSYEDEALESLTINGGVIIIHPEHNYAAEYSFDFALGAEEGTESKLIINGGNFIANGLDLTLAVRPLPTDSQGRKVVPKKLDIPEELSNGQVLLTLPGGIHRVETAVNGSLVVFLPEEINVEDVQIGSTAADYSKVDQAITTVPADLSGYTPESVEKLQNALDAVVRDLDYTQQDAVDGYAAAIEAAIKGLVKIQEPEEEEGTSSGDDQGSSGTKQTPGTKPDAGSHTPRTDNADNASGNAPETGDSGYTGSYMTILILSAAVLAGTGILKRKRAGR